jgi:hypothetical protein
MPKISAISEIVNPSMYIISEYISKTLDFFQLLNIRIAEMVKIEIKSNIFLRFLLTKSNLYRRFIYR